MFSTTELERLLARPIQARVGPAERRGLAGQRVLITGAGGSIGSALAREIAACRPSTLALFDQSELGLFTAEHDLRAAHPHLPIDVHLADVTRRAAVARACDQTQPDVVYHAAAYKHVTMAERAVSAAALVNVLGTAEVAMAAAQAGARFVLISSDKAADPLSVMGATKRLAERVTLSLVSPQFRPLVVRFGNVLGSSGSVLPVMRDRIRRGLPLLVTDPDATRYFMTPTEAVALVLRADRLSHSAETFWLDMGNPVRLGDLAERLLDLERDNGYRSVPIVVVGLRPGEKRCESLLDPALVFERTVDRRIRVARDVTRAGPDVASAVRRIRRAVARGDDRAVLETLVESVPGFAPSAAARDMAWQPRPESAARPVKPGGLAA